VRPEYTFTEPKTSLGDADKNCPFLCGSGIDDESKKEII
jgi:hypothetical protein